MSLASIVLCVIFYAVLIVLLVRVLRINDTEAAVEAALKNNLTIEGPYSRKNARWTRSAWTD